MIIVGDNLIQLCTDKLGHDMWVSSLHVLFY